MKNISLLSALFVTFAILAASPAHAHQGDGNISDEEEAKIVEEKTDDKVAAKVGSCKAGPDIGGTPSYTCTSSGQVFTGFSAASTCAMRCN